MFANLVPQTTKRIFTFIVSLFGYQPRPAASLITQQQAHFVLTTTPHLDASIVLIHHPNQLPRTDAWTIYSWLQHLPQRSLYDMFVDALRQNKPVNASSLPPTISHGFNSSSSSILSQVKQVLVIQQHVRDIIHHPLLLPQHQHQRQHQQDDNDMLIASAAALKQLIRLASTSLHSHSALALLALVAILDELLERAPFALQRHALVRAKLGRVIVLEMAALLKTFSLPHRQKLTYQYKNGEKHELHRWTDHLIACLKPPTLLYEKHWILAWLTRVCRAAAQYDTHWQFKQEYDQVILLAKEHL